MKAVRPSLTSTDQLIKGTFQIRGKFTNAITRVLSGLLFWMLLLTTTAYGQNCQVSADEISGPSNACAFIGTIGEVATYTVTATNTSGFTWTIPYQATLISGQGTNTIQLKYKNSFSMGNISVSIASACGENPINRTIKITKSLPTAPADVTGPANVCDLVTAGEAATYSVVPVPDVNRYNWTVPAGASIVGGQGTTAITVMFTSTFKSGNVKVRSIAGCGGSVFVLYPVTAKGPVGHATITGRATGICSPENVIEYSIDPVPFATSYMWSTNVPGATVVGDGTKATITFPSFMSGAVSVSAVGGCGVSQVGRLNVSSKGLKAGVINGTDTACVGSVQTFSIAPVGGATSYTWSVPNGTVINEGAGTASITVAIGSESGLVTVQPLNTCGPGMSSSLDVLVDECPDEPGGPGEVDPNISLYPNPTSGIIHLQFTTANTGSYKVTVTHPTGACTVFTTTGSYAAGENKVCIDLTALGDGYYIFYLTTGEFNHQERIEVKHCGG